MPTKRQYFKETVILHFPVLNHISECLKGFVSSRHASFNFLCPEGYLKSHFPITTKSFIKSDLCIHSGGDKHTSCHGGLEEYTLGERQLLELQFGMTRMSAPPCGTTKLDMKYACNLSIFCTKHWIHWREHKILFSVLYMRKTSLAYNINHRGTTQYVINKDVSMKSSIWYQCPGMYINKQHSYWRQNI